MQCNRRNTFKLLGLALALGGLGQPAKATYYDGDDDEGFRSGKVFTSSNAVAGNAAGFRNRGSMLEAVAGSVRGLSAATGTGSAQVSEAFGGAAGAAALSSYRFADAAPAQPIIISASVGTTQSAACWVVITPNGRYAYTTNTASGTISLYGVQRGGQLSLLQGVAATSGAGPIDAAISPNGRRLFVLDAGSDTIAAFSVARDGTHGNPSSVGGVPDGSNGLAAN